MNYPAYFDRAVIISLGILNCIVCLAHTLTLWQFPFFTSTFVILLFQFSTSSNCWYERFSKTKPIPKKHRNKNLPLLIFGRIHILTNAHFISTPKTLCFQGLKHTKRPYAEEFSSTQGLCFLSLFFSVRLSLFAFGG